MITAKTYRSGLMTGKFDSMRLGEIIRRDALLRLIELERLKQPLLKSRFTQREITHLGGWGVGLTAL